MIPPQPWHRFWTHQQPSCQLLPPAPPPRSRTHCCFSRAPVTLRLVSQSPDSVLSCCQMWRLRLTRTGGAERRRTKLFYHMQPLHTHPPTGAISLLGRAAIRSRHAAARDIRSAKAPTHPLLCWHSNIKSLRQCARWGHRRALPSGPQTCSMPRPHTRDLIFCLNETNCCLPARLGRGVMSILAGAAGLKLLCLDMSDLR